jgi:hypothetical protein
VLTQFIMGPTLAVNWRTTALGHDLPFMQRQVLAAKPSFVALSSRWDPLLRLFKYRIQDRVATLGVVGERRSDS